MYIYKDSEVGIYLSIALFSTFHYKEVNLSNLRIVSKPR